MNVEKRLKYRPESDFILYAISSREDIYRISWLINNILKTELKRAGNLELWNKNAEVPYKFDYYEYNKNDSQTVYRLISNKSADGFLDIKHKMFDYFLQITGLPENNKQNIYNTILQENEILAVKTIDNPEKELKEKLMI